jgi:hypothetical protein
VNFQHYAFCAANANQPLADNRHAWRLGDS